jgi:predicted transcriptional regulator/transcriptional regulator with XRE-family HTH domain
MATSSADRKLFLGARLKRLRRDLALTQTRMAEDLGVSPSYLNLLERNQRPVTAQVLLRLAETYDLDLRSLSADPEGSGAGLNEVFADALFGDIALPRHELADLADNAPGVVEGITRLYRAYLDQRQMTNLGAVGRPEDATLGDVMVTPSDWVRDYIQGQKNHFVDLEAAGELIAADLGRETQEAFASLRTRLTERHGIETRVTPIEVLPDSVRRFDPHRRRLFLSEALEPSGRTFSLAYQLALIEHRELIEALCERAGAPDRPTRALLRVSLANYLAAAILMPYQAVHETAEKSGYDLDLLRVRFGVSFEQAAHRLTTLARPGQRGVPFFLVRVDSAGNISKRFAGSAFPFSRFGGACPRWNIHSAFRTPGRTVTQVIETPDGERYFTISRTVPRIAAAFTGGEDAELAVGLGCELKYAERLAYSKGLNLKEPMATPIGPACRICERPACPQRAAAPIRRSLLVDDAVKSVSPYPFVGG